MEMMNRPLLTLAAFLMSLCGTASAAPAMEMPQHTRYLGQPDLALTVAMIDAGGGPRHFDAQRLSAFLAAQHAPAESRHLDARFGAARVARFYTTFGAFINATLGFVRTSQVTLPDAQPAIAHDPYELAASLRAAGVMPSGRFDVGYMIEHLISRPLHIRVMNLANASPAIGPAANADFHVILTAEMDDLRTLYRLPH